MASSREAILAALGRSVAPAASIPGATGPWSRCDDPAADFARALEAAGGRATVVPDERSVATALTTSDEVGTASRIYSTVDALASTVPLDAGLDVLASLDLAVLRTSGPAIAESGAVWWVPADLAERRAAFLAQHLVLVVPAEALVDELHAAYERIDAAAAFGCFVSGPSKTADIEQALVIGAHGPRSLRVFLIGAPGL